MTYLIQEVCSFLNLIKRLQKNPQVHTKKKFSDDLINNDFIDLEVKMVPFDLNLFSQIDLFLS